MVVLPITTARLRLRMPRLDDAPTEIGLTLLIPYLAYLPCEAIGVSAVLAAVSAGLFMGWNAPRILTPPTRIQAYSFWEILVFGINAALFLLLGLELPTVVDESALGFETIYFSAGRRGLQIETAPGELIRLTGAVTAAITKRG